ncbi:hypothetical protein DFH11DRAFT_204591 [Phellopilus nigrolimitatus]|nr:hypothetical protein DFH11DRAFT_204591 [Phellopilus nigrolimitatus]
MRSQSLQLAVISDTSDPARTVISETDSQVASPISTKNFATNEVKTKISSEAETPAHYQGQIQTNTITFMPPNHVVGHISSQVRSAQSVPSGDAVTDPSNVLAAKPTSTRKRKIAVPPETLGASASSTLFINGTHSRPVGKPGRPRKNAPLFILTSDTSPAVPPSTQLTSLLPQPSPGMYPYGGYLPCAPPHMPYPPSTNVDGISAPPMSPYWCHPLMMPGPDPTVQLYGHPPYPYQYTYAYSYLPSMPNSGSAADAPLLSPHATAAPTFTSNGPSIHRFSAAFAQQAQVNTSSNTSAGTSSEQNQQPYVENTLAQATGSETFSSLENITQAPSNSDTAITTAETQLKWQTPGTVPYEAINIKFSGLCSQLTAQIGSDVPVVVSNSRPENSAANERVDRPGPSTVDISCSDAADNDTTDKPTGVKGSNASAGSGSHQGRSGRTGWHGAVLRCC